MKYKIVVMSCDKNEDLWFPFYHCIEKYWNDHPEIIYSTETKINPYYKTICNDLPIEKWTRRVYEVVKTLKCDKVLLMIDDLFVRDYVDDDLLETLSDSVGGIIAGLNFEKSFDPLDIPLGNHISLRNINGKWKTSVMCQLWSKKAILDLFNVDKTPWDFEKDNISNGYLFLISKTGSFIKWGYEDRKWFGIRKGKWCKECKDFFDKENIEIDYSIRGFYE